MPATTTVSREAAAAAQRTADEMAMSVRVCELAEKSYGGSTEDARAHLADRAGDRIQHAARRYAQIYDTIARLERERAMLLRRVRVSLSDLDLLGYEAAASSPAVERMVRKAQES